MSFARCIALGVSLYAFAVGASGAPAAFLARGPVYRFTTGIEPVPGSVLLAGVGGTRWLVDPGRGELVVLEGGAVRAALPLPGEALQRREEGLWSVSAVPGPGGDGAVVWFARGDLGLAWRLEDRSWGAPFRLGEVTGPVTAAAPDLLAYSTPGSSSSAFALFDAVRGQVVRRFGRRRTPAHPLLDREENLWLLAVDGSEGGRELVAAGVYFPEIRVYSLPEGAFRGTIALPSRVVAQLEEARRRALEKARAEAGCRECLDVNLVVFGDALAARGGVAWVHLAGQTQLVHLEKAKATAVPLDLPASGGAGLTGMVVSPPDLLLVSETGIERLRATDALPLHLGSVLSTGGEPVAGAMVTYAGDDGRTFTTVAAADGSFVLQGLRIAASGRLEVRAAGHRPFRRRGRLEHLLAAPIVLEALPSVCLRVVNISGEPVTRYAVTLLRPVDRLGAAGSERGVRKDVHDEEGLFCLRSPWPLPVEVEVEAEGYALVRRRVSGERGETEVELEPEARLRVRVVSEEDDAPVDGAAVQLFPPEEAERAVREAVPSGSCRTDATGVCELRKVPAGTYGLEVTADGFLDWSREVTLEAAGAERRDGGQEVTLRRGARIHVSVVHGPEAGPVSGVRVSLRGVGRPLPRPFSCETGVDGGCRLKGVPPGLYEVTAVKPSVGARKKKVAVQEERREIAVRLELTGELRVEGVVHGVGNYPDLAFQVLAGQPGFRRRTDVSASGEFVLEGVPAGPTWFYVLDARSGSNYAFVKRQLEGEDGVCRVEIDLQPPLRLWGRVSLGDAPCDSCAVAAEDAGAGSLGVRVSTPTAADGSYELRLPTSGAYRVSATDPLSGGTAGTMVEVRDDTPLDLEIAGGSIRGSVLSATGGEPVPGAVVTAFDRGAATLAQTRSDDRGSFLLRGLPLRSLRIVAVHGSAATSETVDLGQGGEAEVTLYLEDRDGLRLRVLNPAGQPVRLLDAWIGGPRGSSSAVRGVIAGEDGAVELPAFSSGPHTVVLHPPGLARIALRGVVPAEEPIAVVVPLPASLSVQMAPGTGACSIELAGGGGRPLALDLGPPGPRVMQGSGANFNALPPGPVTVRLTTCDGEVVSGTTTLAPGQPAALVLPVPGSGGGG